METHSTPAIYRSSVLYRTLTNPHRKFWKAVRDTAYFVYVGWPLLVALGVVVRSFV